MLCGERIGDFLAGDRAEQLAVGAGACGNLDLRAPQLLCNGLSLSLLAGLLGLLGLLLQLHGVHRVSSGENGELAGQEEVSCVTLRHLDQLALLALTLNILL